MFPLIALKIVEKSRIPISLNMLENIIIPPFEKKELVGPTKRKINVVSPQD